jgi:methylenetetrahydrofolate reductase (NADPH)
MLQHIAPHKKMRHQLERLRLDMDKGAIQSLVKGYSIETTVREAERIEKFTNIVPSRTRIYIVHVPGASLAGTVALAARLRKEGLEPVPHIVARHVDTFATLDDFLSRLQFDAGVTQILAVAGDTAPPVGEIESSLQVLESGILEKHGIKNIGVAGHAEGHPTVPDAALRDALRRKNEYARKTGAEVYILTQFIFAAKPVIEWEGSHGEDIGGLPITVGLPGLASVRTLLKYAGDCGIGNSIQALSKRAASLTRLLTVSTPDDIIVDLARYRTSNVKTRITGVHFFPFGGFSRTADWANSIVAGNFEVTTDGGLKITSAVNP